VKIKERVEEQLTEQHNYIIFVTTMIAFLKFLVAVPIAIRNYIEHL
jgi:hypothetical protein